MKIKLRCKKCGYIIDAELELNPLGSLKPSKKNPGSGIKIDKDSLDKLLEIAKGASREDLEKLGLQIEPSEWENALERASIRRFLLENIKITKEQREQQAEKYVVGVEPWMMGDSFKDVDLASSEVKSMGVEDLRLIPGVTMQKKVYGVTKGRDKEVLHGVRFLVCLDGSGSMISGTTQPLAQGKIGKALLIGKEVYDMCMKLGFEYHLAIFSDKGVRVEDKRMKAFWSDAVERASYQIWNGGTRLAEGLKQFTDEEYKDANVLVISDMDIADLKETKDRVIEIARQTNTFKIILVEEATIDMEERIKDVKALFPPDINLSIIYIPVRR